MTSLEILSLHSSSIVERQRLTAHDVGNELRL